MLGRLRRLPLDRISFQIAALVVGSLFAINVFIAAVFLVMRPDFGPPEFGGATIASVARLASIESGPARMNLLMTAQRAYPDLDIRPATDDEIGSGQTDGRFGRLARDLGPGFKVLARISADHVDRVLILFPDGDSIAARSPEFRKPPLIGGPWVTALLFGALSILLLSLWATRSLTAPLSSFARAAEDFSLTHAPSPFPERGPFEIRSVARALNRMRERTVNLISDRTRMLAAISHDLRTPLTRLRLRSEFIEDSGQREQMLRDIDQMRAMLDAVLSYLRDNHAEGVKTLDVATTLQLISDQFTDMGYRVQYSGPAHATLKARPNDINRAVTNLVENAVKYSANTNIRLSLGADEISIDVEDDGPGIASALKEIAFEPFVRGDAARSLNNGAGFGLGLTIARTIIDSHGGTLSLRDRLPSGTVAHIALPRQNVVS